MAEEKNVSTAEKPIEAKIAKPKLTPVYDLLEGAIKVWWKNIIKFIRVYLWGVLFTLIPAAIAVILVLLFRRIDFNTNIYLQILMFVLFAACFVVAIYYIMRAYIGMFLLVKKNYEGNELEIFKETKKYFASYLGLSVLTAVLVLLWACLLIIPGIIYSIFYSFAVYAFFFEGLKGMKAIKRSKELVRNYWWPVFGRFAVIATVLYVFTMIISIPLHYSDVNSFFYSFWTSIMQIINFLIGPISLLYFYQIYQDLVKIKK